MRRCPICPLPSGEVQRFVAGSRNQTAEQIQRLGNVTQVMVDHKLAFENVLHITPNAIANFNNIYYPNGGSVTGAFSLVNFSNPVQAICGMIGAVENTTAPETAKLCAQYLGPALRLMNFNELPLPINAYLRPAINPDRIDLHRPEARAGRRRARATRPSHRRRCPPTPARATYRRRRAGTGRRTTGRDSMRLRSATKRRPTPSPAVIHNAPPVEPPHIISNIPAQAPTVEGMLLPGTPGAAGRPQCTPVACGRGAAIMIRGMK